ncbi:aldo/keto reductase [Flagellimonas zhangzhouensis]|uniref:Predicted oxidoreductase n=1 Tax=Flagellimonas zhangzhouensis TaxID=1073328 RepID=A0A1H2Y1A9_9FLAO|nr:aldo/keto reductase [Allomuricauda zhangzhouensis]SDQ93954.1 Predicted oxidoreductase [Allomuricauda zhangzhouensis]SDW98588.1 Predicted oxidoreductase [Allomuricauda zhangzhouensis]
MKKVKIGSTDLEVAPINLGGNVFGWTLDKDASFKILDAFVDKGFNFIDTADMYSYWVDGGEGGQSETILGEWMKARGNRSDVIMATKVGGETGTHPVDTSKKHILETVDKSLQRLQTDYIDLYYTHFDDNKTPIEETLEAYDEIIKAGKVRYIAASNVSPERLEESFVVAEKNGLPKYQALQPHYNLLERKGYETDYAPLAEKYNLTVFPYWSLASGFLTGKYRSEDDLNKSVRGGSVKKYLNDKGLGVIKALDQVAEKHNTTQATVSLAWLLAQPNLGAPIASATSERQLETLFNAPELQLDSEDLELLDKASSY